MIKAIANKQVVVGADFAGSELKEATKKHLIARGWKVTGLTPIEAESDIYHRVGFALGSKIVEDEFERALALCGTGMGIRVAASRVPHIHVAAAELIRVVKRATAASGCDLLAMGGFQIGHRLDMAMADAFLESHLGSGYEDQGGFLEYHRVDFNECEHFDYEAYETNRFQVVNPTTTVLGSEPGGLAY